MRALVPEAFPDGVLDPALLAALFGNAAASEPESERFGLTWPGKRSAFRMAHLPAAGGLQPEARKSADFADTRNVFVDGENLEVLKLMYRAYYRSVKMIYIDPPYNRGKDDLVYVDDFSDPLQVYLEATRQSDVLGRLLTSNPETSGRRHANWLSMMYPRLLVARHLLTDDGVILVSCNDIEQHHLRLLLNEVFGEENFLATFVWNNEGNIDNQSKIKTNHEYIHAFARDARKYARPTVIDPNIEESSKLYRDEIENSITKNGPANPPSKVLLPAGFPAAFEDGVIKKRTNKWPKIYDDVVVKDHVLVNTVTVESGWSSRNLLQLYIDNKFSPILDADEKETRFDITKTGAIYGYKVRPRTQGHVLTVIRNVGTTKQNSNMLRRWGLHFEYPKPVKLLQYLCQIFTGQDDLVVDFFAGSGTLAQAVMEQNFADGGSRRFLVVQIPEELAEDSPGHAAGFRTISEMAIKRVSCAAQEIQERVAADRRDIERESAIDLGMRVFRLTHSSFQHWQGTSTKKAQDYVTEMSLHLEGLAAKWNKETLLWEVLLHQGVALDAEIETLNVAGTKVHRVARGDASIYLCFADRLPQGLAASLPARGDDVFICRDAALNDSTAANLAANARLITV